MNLLLDTNVVSELRKLGAGKASPAVAAWARQVDLADVAISSVTVHELELGVLAKERSDPSQGRVLRDWLETQVFEEFQGRVLPVDFAVAKAAAAFSSPDPAPFRDALIGATALVAGIAVATRNTADFERLAGVRLVNPWLFQSTDEHPNPS
ncbi:MAG: type II toxin-antitoxin system VapC family toxin [Bifidobacteriaceae bacterium]|jgi:predicted nucleic acid-binding protein|nr:type II toxin-antitoxin system VapC family toxin [Bifidobacteriaceae bacterium]